MPKVPSSQPFRLVAERVSIRDFVENDRDAFLKWSTFDEMYTWMKWRLASRDEAIAQFDRLLNDPGRTDRARKHWYLAAVNGNGEFLGFAGFDLHQDDTIEFGWYLSPTWWNRGYATEITKLVLSFGFEKLGVLLIWATCDPENLASRRVMEKCGLEVQDEHTIQTWRGPRARLRMAIGRARWDETQSGSRRGSHVEGFEVDS